MLHLEGSRRAETESSTRITLTMSVIVERDARPAVSRE